MMELKVSVDYCDVIVMTRLVDSIVKSYEVAKLDPPEELTALEKLIHKINFESSSSILSLAATQLFDVEGKSDEQTQERVKNFLKSKHREPTPVPDDKRINLNVSVVDKDGKSETVFSSEIGPEDTRDTQTEKPDKSADKSKPKSNVVAFRPQTKDKNVKRRSVDDYVGDAGAKPENAHEVESRTELFDIHVDEVTEKDFEEVKDTEVEEVEKPKPLPERSPAKPDAEEDNDSTGSKD